jgi:hypothetical protein
MVGNDRDFRRSEQGELRLLIQTEGDVNYTTTLN